MKRIAFTSALFLFVAAFGADAIDKNYLKYASTRRYCVSRKTEGDKVITTWYRNGKPDWIQPSVTTNAVRHIVGKEQNNALQNELEKTATVARNLFVSYTNQLAKTAAFSNAYVIVSAQATAATAKIQDEIADLQAKIEKYEGYKTKYPLLKTVWQAFIDDAENRIKILQALTGGV